MSRLLFKKWLLSEMADYGFEKNYHGRPKGGTEELEGNEPFKPLDGSKIVTELRKLPALGPNAPYRKWHDMVEWGTGSGAIQVGVTPLGCMKIVVRQQINDLQGEPTWICQNVVPLGDNEAINKEEVIAHDVYDKVNEISQGMLPSPAREYNELHRLSNKLWTAAKRNHPSYCMFPVSFRKQNEDYYKLVFEFRGQGVLRQQPSKPARAEQFDIDVFWDSKKGLIKIWGYDIDSTLSQHSWKVQPSNFDEWFSPSQETEDIIDNVIKIFMQY
jgi:hypothetical protein